MRMNDLAERLECRPGGEPGVEIHGVAGIEQAGPGEVTFLANRRYAPDLTRTVGSAVFVEEGVEVEREAGGAAVEKLRTSNPYLSFAKAIELFYEAPKYAPGIHATAMIAKTARIGAGTHVGPYCFVDEDAVIGGNAVLHSFVTIYRGARIGTNFFAHAHAVVREFFRIGNRVILQNGVIIGGDGLGYAKNPDGTWYKMMQSGPAGVGDDVEVPADGCIDRATGGETRIGRGTKIDDLVLVGHASKVGGNSMLCGQVGLAGSTRIGENCILAGQVGTAGHLTVGDGAVITAQSGVPNDVPERALYSGYPAVGNREWLRMMAALRRLPELQKRVGELEEKLAGKKE